MYNVYTNVTELLEWENEYFNHILLSDVIWKMMNTPGTLSNGENISYAGGLILGEHKGLKVVHHSGQVPGYSANLIRLPDEKISIAVLGNQNWYNVHDYAFKIADLLLPIENEEILTEGMKPREPVTLLKEELVKFCGDYRFEETGEFRSIVLEGNELLYIRKNGPSSKLVTLSTNMLTFDDRRGVTLEFTFTENGNNGIHWIDGAIEMHGKTHKPYELSQKEMAQYTGVFYSLELNAELIISEEGGQLWTDLIGQHMPLESVAKDQFQIMGMFKITHARSAKGQITNLKLDAPRAGNIRFVKKDSLSIRH